MPEQDLLQRQSALVRTNVAWLGQAANLLASLDDATYRGVGGQVRHVIEFYECFLDGLRQSHIDYDSRRRDPLLEQDRGVAAERVRGLMERLGSAPELSSDRTVYVRMEDSRVQQVPEPLLLSSVGRELQVLSSHSVHHFALIAMMLKTAGQAVDPDFGVAPSTLRYRSLVTAACICAR